MKVNLYVKTRTGKLETEIVELLEGALETP